MVVSDAFLLELAGIAASLLGFFVVGVFFFVQRGMFPQAADHAQRCLQAATGTIIVLYGMTLLISLALVVVPVFWAALIFLVCTTVLLWSVWRLSLAISQLHRVVPARVMSQSWMWMAATAVAVTPWATGGLHPSRSQITLAIALTGIFAFASTASLVLSAFEISTLETTAEEPSVPMNLGPVGEVRIPNEQQESVDIPTPVTSGRT